MLNEDPFWEKALEELNSGSQDADLWRECLRANHENRSLAEMQYLRDRSKQLAERHRDQEARARERSVRAEFSQAMRIVEGLPKGQCPECRAVILLSAQSCPKCSVSLVPASGRKILPLSGSKG